ncbi:MAG: hypothetical protein Q4G48_04250 [Bacteroidia bacterium]|nr:hypothetical protein [Bacteroidia bacterium]
MGVLKFTTKISGNGTIQLPKNSAFANKEVEIIIMPKTKQNRAKSSKATEFVQKWGGFLTNVNPEESKYNYLSEKYR